MRRLPIKQECSYCGTLSGGKEVKCVSCAGPLEGVVIYDGPPVYRTGSVYDDGDGFFLRGY